MGPEPYSLAIMFRENMGKMIFRNVRIYATDIDSSNLFEKIIKHGIYPDEQVKRIPKDIFRRYFSNADTPNNFQVSEEIRKAVNYKKHDLLSLEPIRKDLSLIVCKNVLLHFKQEERITVIKMFHSALMEGGFFVTEQTQKMPDCVQDMFEPAVSNAQLFRKVG